MIVAIITEHYLSFAMLFMQHWGRDHKGIMTERKSLMQTQLEFLGKLMTKTNKQGGKDESFKKLGRSVCKRKD
jgi:hypothetical protein